MKKKTVIEDTTTQADDNEEDIAIIGLSGRYPQANNINEFWRNLLESKDCIVTAPNERWNNLQGVTQGSAENIIKNIDFGGFISDVDTFDPLLFNISPREAQIMDPNERLFLETSWELLESAGYTKTRIQEICQGNVGVFVGSMYQHYSLFHRIRKLKQQSLFHRQVGLLIVFHIILISMA